MTPIEGWTINFGQPFSSIPFFPRNKPMLIVRSFDSDSFSPLSLISPPPPPPPPIITCYRGREPLISCAFLLIKSLLSSFQRVSLCTESPPPWVLIFTPPPRQSFPPPPPFLITTPVPPGSCFSPPLTLWSFRKLAGRGCEKDASLFAPPRLPFF